MNYDEKLKYYVEKTKYSVRYDSLLQDKIIIVRGPVGILSLFVLR